MLLMPILAVSMLNAGIPWVHTYVYAKSDTLEMLTRPAQVLGNQINRKQTSKQRKIKNRRKYLQGNYSPRLFSYTHRVISTECKKKKKKTFKMTPLIKNSNK